MPPPWWTNWALASPSVLKPFEVAYNMFFLAAWACSFLRADHQILYRRSSRDFYGVDGLRMLRHGFVHAYGWSDAVLHALCHGLTIINLFVFAVGTPAGLHSGVGLGVDTGVFLSPSYFQL
jgi:hypothetical protein